MKNKIEILVNDLNPATNKGRFKYAIINDCEGNKAIVASRMLPAPAEAFDVSGVIDEYLNQNNMESTIVYGGGIFFKIDSKDEIILLADSGDFGGVLDDVWNEFIDRGVIKIKPILPQNRILLEAHIYKRSK
jgi:hypothetical protein